MCLQAPRVVGIYSVGADCLGFSEVVIGATNAFDDITRPSGETGFPDSSRLELFRHAYALVWRRNVLDGGGHTHRSVCCRHWLCLQVSDRPEAPAAQRSPRTHQPPAE